MFPNQPSTNGVPPQNSTPAFTPPAPPQQQPQPVAAPVYYQTPPAPQAPQPQPYYGQPQQQYAPSQPQYYQQPPVAPVMPQGAVPVSPGTFVAPSPAGQPATPPQQQAHPYGQLYNDLAQKYGSTPDKIRELLGDNPAEVVVRAAQMQQQAQGQPTVPTPPGQPQPQQGQPQPSYTLPENWQSYVRTDEKTGLFVPVSNDPAVQQIASIANQNRLAEVRRVQLMSQGLDKYIEQDPQAREWFTRNVQQAAEQVVQKQQMQQKVEQYRQQYEHLLVVTDPASRQPLTDAQGNRLPTPLGHAFAKHYRGLAQAGLNDVDRLFQTAWMYANNELQQAGLLPAQGQQQPVQPLQPPTGYGMPFMTMTPPGMMQPNSFMSPPQPQYGMYQGGNAANPRPLAAMDVSVEDAFRAATAHMPDTGLPVSAYLDEFLNQNPNGQRQPLTYAR